MTTKPKVRFEPTEAAKVTIEAHKKQLEKSYTEIRTLFTTSSAALLVAASFIYQHSKFNPRMTMVLLVAMGSLIFGLYMCVASAFVSSRFKVAAINNLGRRKVTSASMKEQFNPLLWMALIPFALGSVILFAVVAAHIQLM